ncbi:hypothetical protein [Arthrobacter sp. ZGTC412]|uniref:hypothetical protein n=1 Tax=Arthrobacter sp. ZGTC412 TaxID=2058900 RepID=UPI000CE3F621|nr:hypothetical protein [Arthrobacter sp. ZGTC412]
MRIQLQRQHIRWNAVCLALFLRRAALGFSWHRRSFRFAREGLLSFILLCEALVRLRWEAVGGYLAKAFTQIN